jgi:mono/diheme cytochrome c family protein
MPRATTPDCRSRRAAFLAALCLLLAGCGGGGDPDAGRKVFHESMCARCHGERREGTEFAPALKGLGDRWSEEDLTVYFLDPPKWVARDPRLKGLSSRYSMVMPRFTMDDDVRRDLARYLLSTDE